jgi:hypothetical protein
MTLTVDHLRMPAINPGVISKIIVENGVKGIRKQTSRGLGGDDPMVGYGEDAIRQRARLGLRTDIMDLRRTGDMMDSLGKTSQKIEGGNRLRSREYTIWDVLKVGVGVGARRGSDRNLQKKKAIIIQNWANKHLGHFSREMFKIAKATRRAIAMAIEDSAAVMEKVRLQKRRRADQRRAARAARRSA